MATTLRAPSFAEVNVKERTTLSAESAAADTTLELTSAQGFAADDFILIGHPGVENCEKRQISGLTGLVATVSALTLNHEAYEPVTALRGDKVVFYRAANVDGTIPDDEDFTELAAVDIDPDQQSTYYNDSDGSSGYWYKFTYRNSETEAETDLADATAVRGDDYGHYASLSQIRKDAGLQHNPNIDDELVDEHRRAAESEINSAMTGRYVVPFSSPVPDLITQITIQLAAGLLLLNQYGTTATGSNKDGTAKCKAARALIARLQGETVDGLPPIYLTDYLGDELPRESGISYWPDETTEDADIEDGGSKRAFYMGERF